jgi:hypothetical protein
MYPKKSQELWEFHVIFVNIHQYPEGAGQGILTICNDHKLPASLDAPDADFTIVGDGSKHFTIDGCRRVQPCYGLHAAAFY